MGHSRLKFLGMVGLALMLLAACGSSPAPAAKTYKIGLVTDTGGLNDKSFNPLADVGLEKAKTCLLYTSPSPRDLSTSRMPSSA